MKSESKKIAWLILLGQLFFQLTVIIVVAVSVFLGKADQGMLIGADVGSFLANVIILGIYYLAKRNKNISLPVKRRHSLLIVPAALFSILIWNLIIGACDFALESVLDHPADPTDNVSPLFRFIAIAVLPALFEEFAFRKVIFGSMRKYGVAVAAVFSSILFGLMHQDITQGIFAFGMGLILCYVYEKTGKLIYTVFLHFLNNSISVLLPLIPEYNANGRLIEAILGIIALALVIVIFLIPRLRILMLNKLRVNCNQVKSASKDCYLNVPLVIYIVFCIGMTVVTFVVKYG